MLWRVGGRFSARGPFSGRRGARSPPLVSPKRARAAPSPPRPSEAALLLLLLRAARRGIGGGIVTPRRPSRLASGRPVVGSPARSPRTAGRPAAAPRGAARPRPVARGAAARARAAGARRRRRRRRRRARCVAQRGRRRAAVVPRRRRCRARRRRPAHRVGHVARLSSRLNAAAGLWRGTTLPLPPGSKAMREGDEGRRRARTR